MTASQSFALSDMKFGFGRIGGSDESVYSAMADLWQSPAQAREHMFVEGSPPLAPAPLGGRGHVARVIHTSCTLIPQGLKIVYS